MCPGIEAELKRGYLAKYYYPRTFEFMAAGMVVMMTFLAFTEHWIFAIGSAFCLGGIIALVIRLVSKL